VETQLQVLPDLPRGEVPSASKNAALPCPGSDRALGISRSTAYECIRTGEIPYLRFRRRIVIAAAVLDQMLSVPASEEASS